MEKVAVNGYRYLVVLKEPLPPRLDLYVLCRILNWAGFLPRFMQVEVWVGGRPAAYFYYRLQGNCYVGPSRRLDGGRWVVYGRLYCVRQIGRGRYAVTDGKAACR